MNTENWGLVISNEGPEIIKSNFWDTNIAAAGKFYLSINAGACRLLVPDNRTAYIEEMKTAKTVVLSRGPWAEMGLTDAVEILFDDDSESPFSINMAKKSFDRLIPRSESGRTVVFSVWVRGLKKVWETTGYFRAVDSLPCLKPWNQDTIYKPEPLSNVAAIQNEEMKPSREMSNHERVKSQRDAAMQMKRLTTKTGGSKGFASFGAGDKVSDELAGKFCHMRGKKYHRELPPELQAWYVYPFDAGHSILVLLECHLKETGFAYLDGTMGKKWAEKHLVPVPVRTILRKYRLLGGYVVVDLPYSSLIGVECHEGDEEFDVADRADQHGLAQLQSLYKEGLDELVKDTESGKAFEEGYFGSQSEEKERDLIDKAVKKLLKKLDIASKGENVRNRFGGDSIYLKPEEAALYNYLIGSEAVLMSPQNQAALKQIFQLDDKYMDQLAKEYSNIKVWFRIHNREAYRILID